MTYWSRSFQGLAENLSEVRRFTAAVLGDRPGVDLVVLAASELAGNAVLHSASGRPGGQFVVHVAAFSDRWQIRVDDEGGNGAPVLADAADDDPSETGRGLVMVASISRSWGVIGDHYARAVWAEIPYPAPAERRAAGGIRAGGEIKALEAALDATAAGIADAAQPPVLALQNSDSQVARPPEPSDPRDPRNPSDPSDDPDGTPPYTDRRTVRPPRETAPWELPSRERLRAAGVTELEAMLIEMAYAETMGRV